MIESTPADDAHLDQLLAGVRANLNTVVSAARLHLAGLCPALGKASRELVIAHLTRELSDSASLDACCEMLALAAVELAEQRSADPA
jgi:hypothetical protein